MTHTLSVLVENRPGALARVSNMFARRGFNIESLAVGPTERPDISRITLCVDCDERFAQTHLTHQVPDYAQLAEAYGAAGFTVSSEDELEPALEEALACGRAAVVDARVDPEEKCFPMIPAGAAASDCLEFDAGERVEV